MAIRSTFTLFSVASKSWDRVGVIRIFGSPYVGALDEDVVVIEATPAPAPPVPASEEINVTSTDSEVEIVTVGDGFRYVLIAQKGD